MSEIKVNKISPATGTETTLGDSSDDFLLPSGAEIIAQSGSTITVASGATIANAGTATGFAAGGWTLLAEQATTSGTSITIPAAGIIPSGTKAILISMDQVSTNGSGLAFRLRIGDEDGFETTGYTGCGGQMLSSAVAAASDTGFFLLVGDGSVAANNYSGICELRLQDASTFTWSHRGNMAANTGAHVAMSAGSKTLSKELTQVQFYSHNDFDGGAISVQYMS